MRTHDEFIIDALSFDSAPSDAEAERRAKATGINGLPVLATLSSISFPESFGHDLMHLIPENVVKNMLDLYTGNYKGLDTGKEDYELTPDAVSSIGAACVAASDSTPAAFRARVPNLDTQRHYYTAESYTLFTTLLAPVLFRNRFSKAKYYDHFIELVGIFTDCLKLSIDRDYVDVTLRRRIVDWVQKYEKYFYQYKPHRLSTCVLTIHALLHIPDDILNGGPMWCYWNYITERYVGFLVRSSKSPRHPYASFARRIREIAQNNVIKLTYGLREELDLTDSREEDRTGHTLAEYHGISVLHPHLVGGIKPAVRKAIEKYLLISFEINEEQARRVIPDELSHWGKISFLDGGDKIRGADLNKYSEKNATRDVSFIKYSHDVDKNAHHPRRPVVLERRIAYGQLLEILEFHADLPIITDEDGHITQHPADLLLAVIRPVKLTQKNKLGTPYYQDGQFSPVEVVDVDDLSCLVARIPDHGSGPKKWALCERFDAMGASAPDLGE
uniref:Uncharacterized protein n=1 Tax=Mycena chlorophos TaxID=658473 RepID=A0ABQ0KVJ3_MYCCL|nr:predicted protein [Mycena chlorophos]